MNTELDLDDVANSHPLAERELKMMRDMCCGLQMRIERLLALLERECADVDQIIAALGLPVEQARTESGSLNIPRIVARIVELIDEAPRKENPEIHAAVDATLENGPKP